MSRAALLAVALGIRFLLELCLLAIFFWSAVAIAAPPFGWVLGLVTTAALALFWGVLLSPKRRMEIGTVPRLLLEAILFVGASWLLLEKRHPNLAIAPLGAAVLDKAILMRLELPMERT